MYALRDALRTSPLHVYNENLSFQSGGSPLRGLEVESYHFEMTLRDPRSTLAERSSRVGNDLFFVRANVEMFRDRRKMNSLVIGRTGVSGREVRTNRSGAVLMYDVIVGVPL